MTEDRNEYSLAHIIEKNDVDLLQKELDESSLRTQLNSATFKIPETKKYLPFESLTPLHIAAYYDSFESFLVLQEELEKQNTPLDKILTLRTPGNFYPLHYALSNASYEISKYIIEKDPKQTGYVEEASYYPLTLAVISGMHELVELIFENDKGTITKDQINIAFDKALETRSYPCLKILIDKRTAGSQNDNTQVTIPMKAVRTLSPEAVSLVMEVDQSELRTIFYPRNSGKIESDCFLSRLCKARPSIYKQQIKDALRLLSGQVIEPDTQNRVKGPCHWMCYLGDLEIAHIMLDNFNIKVNRLDENYKTGPYEMIIRSDLKEEDVIAMIKLLIEHDFNVNLISIEDGKLLQKTLLEEFVSFQVDKPKIIEYLLSVGANPDAPSFTSRGSYGTIRNYVKKRRNGVIRALFDKYPPKE